MLHRSNLRAYALTSTIMRHPAALLCVAILFTACGGGSAPESGEAAPSGSFDIVEAAVDDVHAALAGALPLLDGSRLSCVTLAEMYRARIFAHNNNPQPNGGLPIRGVLSLNPAAIAQAEALDAAYARDGGIGDRPLHCMPVLLKDNYDTHDHPSTSGSYAMLGHQAGIDAESVRGLRDAGALILGKANQDEFAYFTTGFSARAIQVTNPYNTLESPAGSSSGTGASIAASFAIGGTGSDTCQSIRHPSSVNGLVGIRPSLGVVSQHGIFPLSHARDTGGPMTRTVRDAALMLTAMASVDERDFRTLEFPAAERPDSYTRFLDRQTHGVAGRNIGVLRQLGDNESPYGTGEQGALIAAAVERLEAMGANIYDIHLPEFSSRGAGNQNFDANDYFNVFESDGGQSPRRCLTSLNSGTANDRGDCFGMQGILETGRVGPRSVALLAVNATGDPDAAGTQEALDAMAAERAYVTGIMDALVDADGEPVRDENGEQVRLDAFVLSPGPTGGRTCDLGSTTHMGSIVVPVGFDASAAGPMDREGRGVPRGMEIFVRRFDEGTGIGIAYDYEQATQHRAPPMIAPGPLSGSETIASFNARLQQALMVAASAAPEDIPVETLLEAIATLFGTRPDGAQD